MISIFGLVVLIVFTVFAYRTANDYGRNGVVWAAITFGTGFALQIVLPVVAVIASAIGMMVTGSTEQEVREGVPELTIMILGLVLSFFSGYYILKFLSKIPDDDPVLPEAPPAPPQDFN